MRQNISRIFATQSKVTQISSQSNFYYDSIKEFFNYVFEVYLYLLCI
jgi:hypothetical protein